MKPLKTTLITALLLLAGNALYAQESNDITASATVLDAITVNSLAPLSFGDVERNSASSVLTSDVDNRGQFTILGSDRSLLLNFTLPTELTDGAANTLPISFSNSDAFWNNGNGDNTFDPNADDVAAEIDNGDVDVYIGGTVTAGAAQAAGEYTGTITLTAEYDL